MNWIKRYFEFDKLATKFRNELFGGITTFLGRVIHLLREVVSEKYENWVFRSTS